MRPIGAKICPLMGKNVSKQWDFCRAAPQILSAPTPMHFKAISRKFFSHFRHFHAFFKWGFIPVGNFRFFMQVKMRTLKKCIMGNWNYGMPTEQEKAGEGVRCTLIKGYQYAKMVTYLTYHQGQGICWVVTMPWWHVASCYWLICLWYDLSNHSVRLVVSKIVDWNRPKRTVFSWFSKPIPAPTYSTPVY